MKRWYAYALAHKVALGVAGGVLLAGGWVVLGHGSSSSVQTLVMAPQDFAEVVSTSGKVVAAQDVDMGFSQGGRVGHVYVTVGQRVSAGQLLAEVENADLRAGVAQQQAVLAQQQAKLDSLTVGAQPSDIAASQAALDKAQQDLDNYYQSIVDSAQSAYTAADDAVRTQLAPLFTSAESNAPQLTFSTASFQTAVNAQNMRVSVGAALNVWRDKLAALASPGNAQLEQLLSDSLGNLDSVRSLLGAVSSALDSSTLSGSTLTADKAYLSAGQSEVNAAVKSLNTISQNIASQKATVSQAQAQLDLKRAGTTAQDLAAQRALVAQAQAAVEQAQAQLAKTQIVAPFSGVVTKVDAKVGLATAANVPQVSLESAGIFQIESYIPEVSVAGVAVGNPAHVTLDAYGESVPFEASVVSIDPAETVRDGVSTYRVVLQFSQADPRIRSGMTATTEITTADHPGALVVPAGAVFMRAGRPYLEVRRDSQTLDVAVVLGATSIGEVEVVSGLSAGDEVVLTPDPSR